MTNSTYTPIVSIHTHYDTEVLNESYASCVCTHITNCYPMPKPVRDTQ